MIVQGFLTKKEFISNAKFVVNEFFELSPLALTYSRDRGEYLSLQYPGNTLHTFLTIQDTPVEQTVAFEKVTQLVTAASDFLNALLQPKDYSRVTPWMLASFPEEIQSFSYGNVHEGQFYTLPAWYAFTTINGDEYKIWINNNAFENQFGGQEILVSPPLSNLNQFFLSYSQVTDVLSSRTALHEMDALQALRENIPETQSRIIEIRFYNKNNPSQYMNTYWGVLIYGRAGDNIDSIKDAIQTYLLQNSIHSEEEWRAILPGIFSRTEFMLFPRWDKISIPNQGTQAALYSSLLELSDQASYVLQRHPETLSEGALYNRNFSIMPFDYKTLMVLTVAGETNDTNHRKLQVLFPDYLPVNTLTHDFSRMSKGTQDWVVHMSKLLVLAEKATRFSTVSPPYRRVLRNDKLFVSIVYENVNYLVKTLND